MEDRIREAYARAFRELHQQLREHVKGLDPGTLNWRPLPKANSIAVLITHTVGSELEMIHAVRSDVIPRDRDSEFRVEADADQLIAMIDKADREMGELIGALTEEDLTQPRPRGDRPPELGIYWLATNYGHAREHLAHIELTKQLYDSRT